MGGGVHAVPKGDPEQGTPPPHLTRPSSRRRSCQSRRSTSAMACRSSSVRKLRSSSASAPSAMAGTAGAPRGGGREAGGCSRGGSACRACTSDASIWSGTSGPLWGGNHPDPLQREGVEAHHAHTSLQRTPKHPPGTPNEDKRRGGVMPRVLGEGARATARQARGSLAAPPAAGPVPGPALPAASTLPAPRVCAGCLHGAGSAFPRVSWVPRP